MTEPTPAPFRHPTRARREHPRISAGPAPELGYRGSGAHHQTAAGHGDVQSHDPVHDDRNCVPPHRRYGGLGQTGRDIQSPLAARIGIFPFGLQLTSSQVIEIGGGGLVIVAAAVRASFAVTIWIGELLGFEPNLAQLIAAGTSICGASAVIATNPHDEDVAYAIACVTVFGSVAMFAHPIPADAKAWIVAVTTFLQAIALAAMSLETNIGRLTRRAFGPLCSMDSPSRPSRD